MSPNISVHPKHDKPSPSHTPQSSNSATDPQALSQPDGPGSFGPQPLSHEELSPAHTPHSSNSAVDPQA